RRSHRSTIEMVATHDDWRLQFSLCHKLVQCQAKFIALSISQPTNTRGQALEFHALLRQRDPTAQVLVLRKELKHQLVGPGDVRRFARERGPAKWPFAFAKERAYVRRHKAGEVVGIFHALLVGESANVVAVVERHGAKFLEIEHALN